MGTGIVATAAGLLPTHSSALHAFALSVWVLAAALLVLLVTATAAHWLWYPANARRHLENPAMAPFYGAPAMAFLTVGSGALLVGKGLLGSEAAVQVDITLWSIGTLLGLATAVVVPLLMFTAHDLRDGPQATWLMPIVPPMVSASAGAGLVAHLPAGQPRLALLLACYAMFGLSLFASLITITLLWARLAAQHVGPARLVPTLWIVLGPLGQSITAANLLGAAATGVLPAFAPTIQALGVLYGVAAWGFAALWLAIAAAITARTAAKQLPFSLTWWSFTFPVGTVVTGTAELAVHTGATPFAWIADGLYAGLVVAWAAVTLKTLHGLTVTHRLAPIDPAD